MIHQINLNPNNLYYTLTSNETCPDWHTCTMVDTLAACNEKFSDVAGVICKTVSTQFTRLVENCVKCGFKARDTCCTMIATKESYPGPEKAVGIVYDQFQHQVDQQKEALLNFAKNTGNACLDYLSEDYARASLILAGTVIIGASIIYLINRKNRQ